MASLFDEIVVVDCGSTDDTREVASSLGARVFDHTWSDSFAAARNEWFHHSVGDWIFWLDADDRLEEPDVQRLRTLFGQLPDENVAYLMQQRSAADDPSRPATLVDHPRLFRRQEGLAWRYRVHEQILGPLQKLGARIIGTDIAIGHLGYQSPSLVRQKLERNQRLLELDIAEQPDDAFILLNLAKAAAPLGRPDEAFSHLRRCIELAAPGTSFIPKAYALLAEMHRSRGELDQADKVCSEGTAAFPQDLELLYTAGLVSVDRRDRVKARQCFERLLALPAQHNLSGCMEGVAGYLTHHQLALLAREEKRWPEAEAHWREATRLRPEYGPAWLALAELQMRDGREAEARSMIEKLEANPRSALIGGVVRARILAIRREVPQARVLLEQLSGRHPKETWPRLILCEMLLREKIDDGAAESLLQEIVALDPRQEQACRRLSRLRSAKGAS